MEKTFELSTYQKNILNFVNNESGNLLVDAKAGSGKTSTLLLISESILNQNKKCLFLAFNKSIVEELTSKVSSKPNSENCLIKTIHSLGFSFISSYLYRKHQKNYKIDIDTSYLRNIVSGYYTKLCADKIETANFDLTKEELKELHNALIMELTSMCNFVRYYNVNYKSKGSTNFLLGKVGSYLDNNADTIPNYQDVIIYAIDDLKYKFEHPEVIDGVAKYTIDYTDMIYFPVYYDMTIPYSIKSFLDIILVDESQDLSILQQKFVGKLKSYNNRFIFVGDKYQAIYGFAGADNHSIDNIKRNFVLSELPLNVCYRCPEKVIRLAQSIVPSIEWNEKREDKGEVNFLRLNQLKDYFKDENDVLIGRKNKDLLTIYRDLVIGQKKRVKFKNRDLVNKIINELEFVIKEYIKYYNRGYNVDVEFQKILDKEGISIDVGKYAEEIEKIEDEIVRNLVSDKLKELIKNNIASKKILNKQKHNIDYLETCMKEYKEKGEYQFVTNICTEYYDIIESFLEQYRKEKTSILVEKFIEFIREFLLSNMNANVPIISSIHAMKGGESNNVFILDYPLFPYGFRNQTYDELQQEKNLQYVAITRAKKKLYLLELEPDRDRSDKYNSDSHHIVEGLLEVNELEIEEMKKEVVQETSENTHLFSKIPKI